MSVIKLAGNHGEPFPAKQRVYWKKIPVRNFVTIPFTFIIRTRISCITFFFIARLTFDLLAYIRVREMSEIDNRDLCLSRG